MWREVVNLSRAYNVFFLYLRVIVKKKLKKGPKLEELEERGEEEREGRHLLLMQGSPVC